MLFISGKSEHTHLTQSVYEFFTTKYEIDFPESPQHPIVYFRKERKCKTAKGMDRQHNRMVNEACDSWRDYGFRRLTVSRVPASEVVSA